MKRLGVVSALVVIWPLLLVPGGARAAGGLTADEQAMLTELLGQGVIGALVAGATLTPSFAPLRVAPGRTRSSAAPTRARASRTS